jgi:hypothetical protein
MGTTSNSSLATSDEGDMRPDQVKLIAKRLGVTEHAVIDMNRRLGGDASCRGRSRIASPRLKRQYTRRCISFQPSMVRFTAIESCGKGARAPSADRAPAGRSTALCIIGRALSCALRMPSYAKFHNDIGVPIVHVGCHEFKCIWG